MGEGPKKVSKKKIVFVQLDEEITALFERIKNLRYKTVYLVVPRRAVLLQSVVNLKILKQKMEDEDKELAIITGDPSGMKLAHQAGIKVYDHHDMREERRKSEDGEQASALLKPIAASSNEVDMDGPSRLPKKKTSIFEVVNTLRGKDKGFSLSSYLRDRKKSKRDKEALSLSLPPGTKKMLTGIVSVSVLVFILIAYIALPGATLYIEPASSVVSKAVNVSLEPSPTEARDLKVYELSVNTTVSVSHHASGTQSLGAQSSGNLTVINESNQDWPLIKNTRFQTDSGIVFRLQEEVTVPRASSDVPGELEVYVVADALDANGVAVGARGNIGPSPFFLPGLRDSNQEVLYAESYADMSGGVTDVSVVILEDDLVAAREKLEAELENKGLSALRKELLAQSNALGVELNLLEDSDVIHFGAPVIDLPYELIGQEMETFDLEGSIKASGVAYERAALLSILKTEIVASGTPGKQLVRIDDDSVSLNVFEVDLPGSRYKFTAQIQGIEEYQLNTESEAGRQLVEKIKEHIAGNSVEEAERYVQNLEEVNKVEIKVWPVWSPSIPSLAENIRVKSTSKANVIELEE